MKLVPSKVPTRDTRRAESLWATLISAEMLHQMKITPATTYQLHAEDGTPYVATSNIVAALSRACPRPYRLQSRTVGDSKTKRHVWVSCDPGHWEKHEQNRKKKRTTK